jgi:hypothetical protein
MRIALIVLGIIFVFLILGVGIYASYKSFGPYIPGGKTTFVMGFKMEVSEDGDIREASPTNPNMFRRYVKVENSPRYVGRHVWLWYPNGTYIEREPTHSLTAIAVLAPNSVIYMRIRNLYNYTSGYAPNFANELTIYKRTGIDTWDARRFDVTTDAYGVIWLKFTYGDNSPWLKIDSLIFYPEGGAPNEWPLIEQIPSFDTVTTSS